MSGKFGFQQGLFRSIRRQTVYATDYETLFMRLCVCGVICLDILYTLRNVA